MKKISFILIFSVFFKTFAQNEDIKISTVLYINNKPTNDVKYYFIKNNKAYLLPKENEKIILKDTLTTEGISLMAVKDKHKIVFPVYYYRESDYVKIYYDNRFLGNITKKKFKINRLKYLFRKEYYIKIEKFDDIITVFKPEKTYKLIE